MGPADRARLLASLSLALSIAGEPAPARASACPVPAPVLFSYPSAETNRVPANAVPFVVPDGLAEVREVSVKGYSAMPLGQNQRLFFFDPGQPFAAGAHVLEADISPAQNTSVATSALDLFVEFEVEAGLAAPPDQLASARIARALHFLPDWDRTPLNRGYLLEKARAQEDPLDCSPIIADQTWLYCGWGGRADPGDFRVEIEVEGDAIGYLINGFFMPGYCRSAFLPAGDTFEIQTVTATGLGSPQVFTGELEEYVAPAIPYPLYHTPSKAPPLWGSCELSGVRGRGSSLPAGLGLALLSGAVAARRRARQRARSSWC